MGVYILGERERKASDIDIVIKQPYKGRKSGNLQPGRYTQKKKKRVASLYGYAAPL